MLASNQQKSADIAVLRCESKRQGCVDIMGIEAMEQT
jgi:hypothetical protein